MIAEDCAGSAPWEANRNTPVILHVAANSALLTIRSSVLERSGFPVIPVADVTEVDEILPDVTRGLVVLCHSLSAAQQEYVLSKIRQQPGVAGLLITKDNAALALDAAVQAISTGEGPHALVLRAKDLLSGQ